MRILQRLVIILLIIASVQSAFGQESVAHKWIDVNLHSIRHDFARPPQQARSLWHTSLAMYDAWAVYDSIANPFFLGNSMGDYDCSFDGVPSIPDTMTKQEAQELALSYAAYNIIKERYDYPNVDTASVPAIRALMIELNLDTLFTSDDYSTGDPRALGNYIGTQLLEAAAIDGSNEGPGNVLGYLNQYYEPVNDSLPIQEPEFVGNPFIDSLNRYQPLSFVLFCDQIAGNILNAEPQFIGAEWGNVVPFSLSDDVKEVKTREGHDWIVYHDPGPPVRIDTLNSEESQIHQWNMQLVLNWSKHLTSDDPTVWDVSPASIGNFDLADFPTDFADYHEFYDFENGGDASQGHAINPSTGLAYEPQLVKRGDYARILAEFWADGPNSETPPGHWFQIYNEIKEYPEFTWKWEGEGEALPRLDHDVRTYLALGGTMHDAAIASWSIKGYYDFVRPVSSLRAMAELGQISDPELPNYDSTGRGLPLVAGWIELILPGDTMAGEDDEFLYELKVQSWLGPLDEDTCIAGSAPIYHSETAGVGWKLALDWWPYQRPTFVTPAFAGYVSGHSTFSRAAAECMTRITGDRFFPGGMGEFYCVQDDFLVFEDGPSTEVTLQWATYQDASDQCSLSRIWGGIHPPVDDIPGRLIGFEVGNDAFDFANTFILGGLPELVDMQVSDEVITDSDVSSPWTIDLEFSLSMDTLSIPTIEFSPAIDTELTLIEADWTSDTTVTMSYTIIDNGVRIESIAIEVKDTPSRYGLAHEDYSFTGTLLWDTENPSVSEVQININPIDGDAIGSGTFFVSTFFSESMDEGQTVNIAFPVEDPSQALLINVPMSEWTSNTSYQHSFDILDNLLILDDVDISIDSYLDSLGNPGETTFFPDLFDISVVTGLIEDQMNARLIFYPNPIHRGQELKIRSETSLDETALKIYDSLGRLVLAKDIVSDGQQDYTIPTSSLKAGSYLMELRNQKQLSKIQIVILE